MADKCCADSSTDFTQGKRGVVYEQLWNNEELRKGLGRSSSSSSSSSSNSNLETEGEEIEPLSSSPDIRSGGKDPEFLITRPRLPFLQPLTLDL